MFRKAKGHTWVRVQLRSPRSAWLQRPTLWELVLVPLHLSFSLSLSELRIGRLHHKGEHSYSTVIFVFSHQSFTMAALKKNVKNVNLTYCTPSILRHFPPPKFFHLWVMCFRIIIGSIFPFLVAHKIIVHLTIYIILHLTKYGSC